MSPPTKAPPEHRSQRAPGAPDRETTGAPTTDTRVGEAVLLAAQQAAGNQAVSSMLGGTRGIQRAPNDDMVPGTGSVTAVGDEDDKPAPVPSRGSVTVAGNADDRPVPNRGSVTAVADDDDRPAPARKPPPRAGAPRPGAPRPGSPRPGAPGGGPGPIAQPGLGAPVADPKMAGGVPKVEERMWHRAGPTTERDAQISFQRDPSSVIRSRDRHWHWQMWNASQGPAKYGMKAPMIIRAGSLIIVHPNYQGPATVLPDYRGMGVGLGPQAGPGTGDGAGKAGAPAPTTAPGGERPMARLPQDPADTRMRQAVAPNTPFTGEARGTQKAQPVTFSEVKAALEKDPSKVVRSPNDRWHRQGYRLDGGGREPPGAFRVGNLYVISPDYPSMPGVLKLGETAPPKPSVLPQAAQVVGLPGVAFDEKTRFRSSTASLTQVGDRTEIRDRRSEFTPISGQRITGEESEEGDIKRRRESKVAGGIGHGGNLAGFSLGQSETTKVGDNLAAGKSWQAGFGATKDEKLAFNVARNKELVVGTSPTGDPIKRASSTTGGATYDPMTNTFGANAGHKVTGPGGTTRSFTGGMTADDKGSATLNAGGGLESRGGTSITTSLTVGTQVVADEPVELPTGEVEVNYRITDTKGGAVGGGQRMGAQGAPTIGGSFGRSEGDFQGGVKRFKNKKDADEWRRNAGTRLQGERQVAQYIPPTTVAGAMMIPVGESRSSGDVSTTTMGISGSYGGTTLGLSKSESDTRQLTIRRVNGNTVEVTGAVMGTKTKDAAISVPVFSNTKGGTQGTSFAVTWSFDIGTPQGQQAFERYCRNGIPIPGGTFKYMDKGATDEDHDNYKIPFVGTASWSGTTWEVGREDAEGNVAKQFGGKQTHEVKPSWLGKKLGDDQVSSNAQIVRVSENFEDKSARAEFKVSGESGSFNRAEFGKIFLDKGRGGGGKASGEWTLSAEVPVERIRALEEVHPKLRNAMGIDEKMRIYSELVKENGAQMLGGQVGMLSKAWDLHLKGDENFPGGAERTRLNDLKANLTEQLKTKPGDAYTVARVAKEALDKLEKRLANVSDVKKYTDLPDGLRQQQVELVKQHIRDFTQVRQRALGAGIRGGRDEKLEDIQKRATSKHGYDKVQLVDRELAKVQDSIAVKEKQIAQAFVDVRNQSRALGRVVEKDGSIHIRPLRSDEERSTYREIQESTMVRVRLAFALDPKQDALKTQIQGMREAMDKSTDPAARLEALKPIDKAMGERLATLKAILDNIQAAGATIAPYASPKRMGVAPKFWTSVGGEPAALE